MQKVAARRAILLRELAETGYLGSAEVAARMAVSEMTIRRDFMALVGAGEARRLPGGVGLPATASEGVVGFDVRAGSAAGLKRELAERAAGLVPEGAVVGVDAGTTLAPLVAALPPGCTVVTHSLPAMVAAGARADLALIGLGGDFHAGTRSFGGPPTRDALRDLHLDIAVLGAAAVSDGATWSTSSDDADTKRHLAARASRSILVVDSSKFAGRAPLRALDLATVSVILTDTGIPDEVRGSLRDQGCELVVIGTPPGPIR